MMSVLPPAYRDRHDFFTKMKIVSSSSDLFGDLSSDVLYFIDGRVDMGSSSIIVPAGGLSISGHSFDVSVLYSTEPNYTMFVSPAGGSGSLLMKEVGISASGVGSKVYDISGKTSNEAFEMVRVYYTNCSSLGTVDTYRQGLESNTGRIGGTPTLTLKGTWSGGYRMATTLVRGLDDAMNAPLFSAGAGFVMQSRFRTDTNTDLGATASLNDFSETNFPNSSTLQYVNSQVTRNGAQNSDDVTLMPNINHTNLPCFFSGNQGVRNTFVGGRSTITTASTTTMPATIGQKVDLNGVFTENDMQHFDSPSNGQLRHLGSDPREYTIFSNILLEGTANDEVKLYVTKWDDSLSSFVEVGGQQRTINNIAGNRDIGFFNLQVNVILDQNDYIKMQIANLTSSHDVTAEIDGYFIVGGR